jgi:hypothetical protein
VADDVACATTTEAESETAMIQQLPQCAIQPPERLTLLTLGCSLRLSRALYPNITAYSAS